MQTAAREALDLSSESAATQKLYGLDNEVTRSYGERCVLARRLVERGVRFVLIGITCRPRKVPQWGHAWCGGLGLLH